ncbi:MAG: hypothetical protein P8L49_13120 [Opitutaceae bacterium]|nr:hypothetical protein [Opitutaceae bacterium]
MRFLVYGPEFNFEGDWPPGDYFLYVNKYITDGNPWHTISWNASYEGEAAYSKVQWNLGENFKFDGEEDLSSFTLSNDLVKLEVKPIPSFSKTPANNVWIARRLHMGHPNRVSSAVNRGGG